MLNKQSACDCPRMTVLFLSMCVHPAAHHALSRKYQVSNRLDPAQKSYDIQFDVNFPNSAFGLLDASENYSSASHHADLMQTVHASCPVKAGHALG